MKNRIALIAIIPLLFAGCISSQSDEENAFVWDLEITGEVENPIVMGFEDLIAMPHSTIIATLERTTGGEETNVWTGVMLEDLLKIVQPKDSADKITFTAGDGYSVTLALDEIGDGMVAYKMDDIYLPEDEPLRIVLPGIWGPAWVRGLSQINLQSGKGKLEIMGLVKSPQLLSSEDLEEMEKTSVEHYQKQYTGIPVSDLLARARYIYEADEVIFYYGGNKEAMEIENIIENKKAIIWWNEDTFGALIDCGEDRIFIEDLFRIEVHLS
ncbi:MAG: molybdopterin-dependent oxidoreductase [Candidatus Methanofastidiosia archaeon]